MQNFQKRITIVTGHYGSGKTNLAVNLALERAAAGQEVSLADLDLVNPYFRSADFAPLLRERGIELIAPVYAGTNLDTPALTGRLRGALNGSAELIIDVGGDDAGAAALGQYSAALRAMGGYDLLYVVNGYRYLTQEVAETVQILREIESSARLTATGVVNCSHLCGQTTAKDIAGTDAFVQSVAREAGIPLRFTAAEKRLLPELRQLLPESVLYGVEIYVKKPWETSSAACG